MRNCTMTFRSLAALSVCGLLVASVCVFDASSAAARGGGGRGGGGRHGGGMSGAHSSYGRTTSYSGHNTSSSTSYRGTTTSTGSKGSTAGTATSSSGANAGRGSTSTGGSQAGTNGASTGGSQAGGSTGRSSGNTGSSGSQTSSSGGNISTGRGDPTGGRGTGVTISNGAPGPGLPGSSGLPGGGSGPGNNLSSLPPGGGGPGGSGQQAGGGGGNFSGSGVPPSGERRYVPNEIILAFSTSTSDQTIDDVASRFGVTRLGSQEFPLIGVRLYRWRISGNRTVPATVGTMENERLVAFAQPNYLFALQDDSARKSSGRYGDAAQYALRKLQIEQAHELATGKNIPIAVIDSEIDIKHHDLNGTIAKSFDPLGGDETPHSHGTAMAGAIAAHGKLAGIALGPQILAARAFDNTGEAKGTSFAIYKSLQWAVDNGARVINMSFAGPQDPILHRMLTAAHDKGVVLVAAAGNAGPNAAPMYPGADPDVIAVTATDSRDGIFKMANRGQYIAVAAPGVDIIALAPDDAYQITTGTSVAAAHVSGIAALLLEEKPSLTPDEVRSILMSSARLLGPSRDNADSGAGLVDAYKAVTTLANEKPSVAKDDEQAKQ